WHVVAWAAEQANAAKRAADNRDWRMTHLRWSCPILCPNALGRNVARAVTPGKASFRPDRAQPYRQRVPINRKLMDVVMTRAGNDHQLGRRTGQRFQAL